MLFNRVHVICLLALLVLCSCQEETGTSLFNRIDAAHSGIEFNNKIITDDSLNILENEYVYNGAGVAIADLNNDGLDDLFFAGNQVDNKLYLNKGALQFEDISAIAAISKPNREYWSSGVNVIDINHDGLKDIYVCNTMTADATYRANLLYVNQGIDDEGKPTFKELAKAYGVDSDTYSSHAQFFDHDNDGDLDLFIGVNQIYNNNPNQYANPIIGEEAISRDRLYENEWNEDLGHPVFKDISQQAGIVHNGYSHSSLIHDFNSDGWPDIYVANDYVSNDLVFINNQDGTYTNKANDIFKHFSLSAMGSDIGDVNNDGKADFIVSEMQPFYNKRKKLFHGESSYTTEILRKQYNHEIQYTRNTLQLNLGDNPETDLPIYGDIGIMAGVQETDWSWATLFADYDNDGWQDIFIANGFPKDVTDRDFSEFRAFASRLISNEKLIEAIPEVKTPNFIFKNDGDLSFSDVSEDWGIKIPSFTNGAAYGDLDNDGDLDLVTSNIDDQAFLFENQNSLAQNNFIRIRLKGQEKNPAAIGASVEIFTGPSKQRRTILSGRAYLSQSEHVLHFGLGSVTQVDSVVVVWPGNKKQLIEKAEINKTIELVYNTKDIKSIIPKQEFASKFEEVSGQTGLLHLDTDLDYIDFNIQRTIPHKLSQYGPGLAIGDVNGDALDDLFVGGGHQQDEHWFTQNQDGTFSKKSVAYKSEEKQEEDLGTLLFDADGDGDLDLYIVRGSGQFPAEHIFYQDVFMINDGKGNFTRDMTAIPDIRSSGSCVKAADYDRDGDLDLFIGSRAKPGSYPDVGRCYLLKNETVNGKVQFVDNTPDALQYPGLVSDAIWTDINNDSWPDLVIAAEWSAIQLYTNTGGTLQSKTSGLEEYKGWWNSVAAADLDNDGDIDLVGGNYGDNTYFKCSAEEPIRIYGKDFDKNGSIDPLISCMWVDSVGQKHEYPYHPYMDMGKQVVSMRKKFANYGEYGEATMSKILEDEDLEDAIIKSANWMKTSWIENLGRGTFKMHALPLEAQVAPVYGIQTMDYDGNGFVDILMIGNDHGVEVQQGRADASVGLVINNNGGGDLMPLSLDQSSFFVAGDARSLVSLNVLNEKMITVASQNKDSIRVYENLQTQHVEIVKLDPAEVRCAISYSDGSVQVRDFYWGNGFQSQSSRALKVTPKMQSIKFYNNLGEESRSMSFN